MFKQDLREQGYSVDENFPRQSKVNTIWAVLTLIFIFGTFGGLFQFAEPPQPGDNFGADDMFISMIESAGRVLTFGIISGGEVVGYFIFAILVMFAYLFLKLFMTILFCGRIDSIKMKLLENKGMPICHCREALRVWQNVMIYLAPFILMYSMHLFLCIYYAGRPAFMVMFFFMLFFMVFDFTLVVYILCVKIKSKPDYISIDHHIFGYTVYKKTYVRFSRNKNKSTSRFLKTGNEKNIKNGKFNWKN